MGTRNLTMVMLDEQYRVAQYGQWDGYPDGQGATILEFLHKLCHSNGFEEFKDRIRNCSFATKEQLTELQEKIDNKTIPFPEHMSRNMGGKILRAIMDSEDPLLLKNGFSFALDSLFCEWAYVVDLDKEVFEVYQGFNKAKLDKKDRFHESKFSDQEKEAEDYNPEESGYYPIRLAASFSLSDLPPTAKLNDAVHLSLGYTKDKDGYWFEPEGNKR